MAYEMSEPLQKIFGEKLRRDVPLAPYTSARVGGAAENLLEITTIQDLAWTAIQLWKSKTPFLVLGGGSNVLVSDAGVSGVVLLNRARGMRFDEESDPPTVWAASGSNFGLLARQTASRGFASLAWAAGIPGTVGGAVFGNAGAHGDDVSGSLRVAEILHQDGKKEIWSAERMGYDYRSSVLKRKELGQTGQRSPQAVVLAATFNLKHSTVEVVQEEMERYKEYRKQTQPPGASMGSMFKNPPNDFAGRLIEEAGLKGTRIGQAEISPLHANFFINHGNACASDVFALIQLARREVSEKFGVSLEPEIEFVGDW